MPIIQLKPILNCKIQNDYGCNECNTGYRVDNQGNCQVGISGCLLYDSEGHCLGCNNPFFELIAGSCRMTGCLDYRDGFCKSCDSTVGF